MRRFYKGVASTNDWLFHIVVMVGEANAARQSGKGSETKWNSAADRGIMRVKKRRWLAEQGLCDQYMAKRCEGFCV